MLLRVAGQRDAAMPIEAFEQHLHLDRGEVLDFVDRDVPVAEGAPPPPIQWANAKLPGAQQQCVVFRIELGLTLRIAFESLEELFVSALVPFDEASNLLWIERRRALASRDLVEEIAVGQDAGPIVERLRGRLLSRSSPHLLRQCGFDDRVELHALDERGRIVAHGARELGEVTNPLLRGPLVKRRDADAGQSE